MFFSNYTYIVETFKYDTVKKRLGYNVSLYRQRRGWTQANLAEKMQISPAFLMHIERGTRGVSLETIETLAHVLEVDVSELFVMPTGLDIPEGNRTALREQFERDMFESVKKAISDVIDRYAPGV